MGELLFISPGAEQLHLQRARGVSEAERQRGLREKIEAIVDVPIDSISELNQEEQSQAETLACDHRLIACAQYAWGLPVTFGDELQKRRLADRGYEQELRTFRREQEGVRGSAISEDCFTRAWIMCLSVTMSVEQTRGK